MMTINTKGIAAICDEKLLQMHEMWSELTRQKRETYESDSYGGGRLTQECTYTRDTDEAEMTERVVELEKIVAQSRRSIGVIMRV